ncbi:MAG: sulfatase-like hydrolase/transferase, partial [bacterium]
MKWFTSRKLTDNGYTLFLYFSAVSCIVFISSLTYFRSDLFLNSVPEIVFTFLTTLFNPFYILSTLFLLFYILYKILPRLVFKLILFVLTGSFFTYLYIERLVFDQFKFHVNSFVIRILQQPDALQVLGIGPLEIALMLLAILLGVFVAWVIYEGLGRSALPGWLSLLLQGKSRKLLLVLFILLIFAVDKTTYAWYLYNKKISIYLLASDVPLYIPSQMGTFFEELGYQPPVSDKPSLKLLKNRVNYPLKPYRSTVKEREKLPNIILLMSDALRPDMVDPEIMPATYKFSSEKAINFRRHYSGSNGTTQALFTLFYGLPSRYMDFFSRGEVSPVFFDALLANNYQLALFSSKSLGWLGTDQLVFFKVKDHIVDELHADSIISDEMITERALKTLDDHSANSKKPLFLMVFYDSTHIPHFQSKTFKKFVPDNPSLIFNPKSAEDRRRGMNEYKNAASFVDHLFGTLLQKLEKEGYLKNS